MKKRCCFFICQWTNLPNLSRSLDRSGNKDKQREKKKPFSYLRSSPWNYKLQVLWVEMRHLPRLHNCVALHVFLCLATASVL